MAEEKLGDALQDLRAIIHGLRMADFSFVEQEALDEINAMIKELPHPEELAKMANSPGAIKKLREYIGGIMHLIEVYGSRNSEYEARYRSTTGLPPRYKVLKWRCAMSNSKRELKNNLIKDLVKLSNCVDDEGYYEFSDLLVKCAKRIRNNEDPIRDFHEGVTKFLASDLGSIGLRKQAQALTNINIDFDVIKNGLNQVNGWFDYILEFIKDKAVYLQKNPKTVKFIEDLGSIYKNLAQLNTTTKEQISQINQSTSVMEEQMEEELLPSSIVVDGKPRKIEWVDDPNNPGWEMAVVNINDKYYKVQEGEDGGRGLEPLESEEQAEVNEEIMQQESQISVGDYVYNKAGNPYRIVSVEEDGSLIGSALNMGGRKYKLSPKSLTVMSEEDKAQWGGSQSKPESTGQGEVMTDAPAETVQTGQEPSLQQLDRAQLSTLIRQNIPDVWNGGYQGKNVRKLSDEEMRQVVKENIGEGSLKSYIRDVQRAASSKIFNLKKYNIISKTS